MTRRICVLAVALLVAAGCGGARSTTHHPTVDGARPLLASAADEEAPVVGRHVLAWMSAPRAYRLPPQAPTTVTVRFRGREHRIAPPGTFVQTGGVTGGALYVQVAGQGRSRLARYDLASARLVFLPRWLNDGAWLWHPDADGGRLLYGAIVPGRHATLAYEIRLADLRTRRVRVLARYDGHAEYAAPGQLRGAWATWVGCPESTCNVWREDVRTGAGAQSAPDEAPLVWTQIAPAVDERGVVWFERLLPSCDRAEIDRWAGGAARRVLALPRHTAYQYATLGYTGRTLYFDVAGCGTHDLADVFGLSVR